MIFVNHQMAIHDRGKSQQPRPFRRIEDGRFTCLHLFFTFSGDFSWLSKALAQQTRVLFAILNHTIMNYSRVALVSGIFSEIEQRQQRISPISIILFTFTPEFDRFFAHLKCTITHAWNIPCMLTTQKEERKIRDLHPIQQFKCATKPKNKGSCVHELFRLRHSKNKSDIERFSKYHRTAMSMNN